MTQDENREATLETFKTLAEQTKRREAVPDPLNAAIAATAGEPAPDWIGEATGEALAQHDKDKVAAMQAYIQAGVERASAHLAGQEIVTVSGLTTALRVLLEHLYLDHPENYLPK